MRVLGDEALNMKSAGLEELDEVEDGAELGRHNKEREVVVRDKALGGPGELVANNVEQVCAYEWADEAGS